MIDIYDEELEAWRQAMDEQLRAPEGWLSLIGLYWLKPGANTIGSNGASDIALPIDAATVGSIDVDGDQIALNVTGGAPVWVDGEPVTAPIRLRDDHDEAGPSLVALGSLTFYVLRRGDSYALRVRDANSPARRSFGGRAWYPIDPAYRCEATLTRLDTKHTVELENSAGLPSQMTHVGFVTFELAGQPYRLTAYEETQQQLWFIFRDATSGDTTYPGGRYLKAPQTADGHIDLDFNRAYLPPCAFTTFATCPMASKDDRLPLSVEAGEKITP